MTQGLGSRFKVIPLFSPAFHIMLNGLSLCACVGKRSLLIMVALHGLFYLDEKQFRFYSPIIVSEYQT